MSNSLDRARKGIYAAASTPLDSNGAPDADKLAAYCLWLIQAGLDGVAPFGTTGEGNSLPLAFRCRAPERLAAAGLHGDQVIVGTGACALGDTVAATRAAVAAGFTNVLVLPPFYYKDVSDQGLHAYYAGLIEQIGDPKLRVYLYHFPKMSATPVSVALVRRLRSDFGEIIAGLKDSSGDLAGTLRYAREIDDFDVFPTSESMLRDALQGGCAGIISATTSATPALCRRALAAEGEEAEACYAALREVRAAISKHSLMAAVKEIEAWRSGDPGWRRLLPPLVPLSSAAVAELRRDIDRLEARSGILNGDVAAA